MAVAFDRHSFAYLRCCAVCFAQASVASVCSGDRSRGRKEAGDAAKEGHEKGRNIVDDASDQASSIAHDIRDKVLWLDHFTGTSVAANVRSCLTFVQNGLSR